MTRGRSGRSAGNHAPSVQKMWGHVLFLSDTVVGSSLQRVVGVHPRNMQDDRLIAYADMFEGYRFEALTFEFLGGSGDGISLSYRPMLTVDATPVNVEQVSNIDRNAITWPQQTRPARLSISRAELSGEKPWFDTTNTSDTCGAFFVSAFNSAGATVAIDVQIKISYRVGFYGPVDPAITLARLRDLARDTPEDEVLLADESDSEGDTAFPPKINQSCDSLRAPALGRRFASKTCERTLPNHRSPGGGRRAVGTLAKQ